MKVGVVLAAAGVGSRMGTEENKVLLPLDGVPVLVYSLVCFNSLAEVEEVVIVTNSNDREIIAKLAKENIRDKKVYLVLGGQSRQESVYLGLSALSDDTKWAIIHDGARPFITPELVRKGLQAVKVHLAVGIAVPVKDTIKKVKDGFVQETPDRSELWTVQTPQIFDHKLILKAHKEARAKKIIGTDDCMLLETLGYPVSIIRGDYSNIKITTPEDLPRKDGFRIGFGYDVHKFTEGRPLILGGIEIPYPRGLAGHSDADVLTHAVMDALLGAMGRGDIGELFPDTDQKYKGISSLVLLEEVRTVLDEEKLAISNLDLTVMAENPKLRDWKAAIKAKLALSLSIPEKKINIKATTSEGLGFVGREEGIAAQVVVLLQSKN